MSGARDRDARTPGKRSPTRPAEGGAQRTTPRTAAHDHEDDTALERVAHRLASAGASAGAAAGAAAGRLIASARELGEGEREASRLRRAARSPLPNLFDLHPEARLAPRRSLGLLTIPVEAVRGTAVEGPAQRGGDFLPLPRLRGQNWNARWLRLRQAQRNLAILPPIDVLQSREGYWVIDGHNRVAAALYGGQDEIDAVVTHVHLPGDPGGEPKVGSLIAGMAGDEDLRAAGEGRLTRGSSLRTPGEPRKRRR